MNRYLLAGTAAVALSIAAAPAFADPTITLGADSYFENTYTTRVVSPWKLRASSCACKAL